MSKAIDELVLACLDRLEESGAGLEHVLSEVAADHPDEAAAVRARLRALESSGLLAEPGVFGAEAPETLGDFDLVRRLGSGGMGVVYLARQRSMQRSVALKLVRPGHFLHGGAHARFRREAEAAARLAHPNIVAVHTFGEQQGIPYLAMEYVRGASLDRVLARLEEQGAGSGRGRDFLEAVVALAPDDGELPVEADEAFYAGTTSDVVLRIALGIARALAHAHERGVLQRDVKPSNVMLTADGRVLLLDFGLSSVAGTDRVTRSGSQVGSLPYMAPEQLRSEPVDARTDVYGLGVTMYELLCRRSPYLDRQSGERTRAQILDGRPVPPRRIDPSIPRDLQTVCLVAMDADPERRYESAHALAADLANVIALRPIHARPASTWRHVERWARRRPGAAVAVALAGVVVIGGPSLFAWQSARARTRLEAEVERADTHRDEAVAALVRADESHAKTRTALARADRNYELAIDALDLVTRVALDDLHDIPMAEAGRREVLHGIAEYYRQLAQESDPQAGEAPELARERARALMQLGRAQEGLDEFEQAELSLNEAAALLEGAAPGAPAAEDRVTLGRIHGLLGRVADRRGRPAEAASQFDRALELLPAHAADAGEIGRQRARLRTERIHLWRQVGRAAEAREDLDALIAELEATSLDEHPELAEIAAWCYAELTVVDGTRGEAGPTLERLERSLAAREVAFANDPTSRVARQKLAIDLSNLGAVLSDVGDFDGSYERLERAQELAEQLVHDYPGLGVYRGNLASVLVNLSSARLRRSGGDPADEQTRLGGGELERAVEILARLLVDDPSVAEYQSAYLTASLNLSGYYLMIGDPASSLATLEEFTPAFERFARARPTELLSIQAPPMIAVNRLHALIGLDRPAQACEHARGMIGVQRTGLIAAAAELLGGMMPRLADRPEEAARVRETQIELVAVAADSSPSAEELARLRSLAVELADPDLDVILAE